MAHKRKAGRKRKNGPRTPTGKLSRAYQTIARDNGTFELQNKRKAVAGDADPALSSSVPGILMAHGFFDREQFDQAMTYRRLRCAIFGPPWPSNTISGEITERRLANLKHRLSDLERRISHQQRHVLANVSVFDRIPSWFYCERLRLKHLPEDHEERQLLISALDAMLDRKPALDRSA